MDTPFDKLANSDAFEALTFDVLAAERFSNLSWRGPGPDGGRDIEATWTTTDPTGQELRTRWYIECKWYTGSVPLSAIEPKLLAALCAKADYLLIVTSSRVMNTAMDSIQRWLQERGHPFRVRYWTGHDIIRRIAKHPTVFEKHFPSQGGAPAWTTRDAEVTRLRALAAYSNEWLVWRVMPSLQWASQQLVLARDVAAAASGVAVELDILLGTIRLHELALSPLPSTKSSLYDVDLAEVLNHVVGTVEKRCKTTFARTAVVDCGVVSSRPVLQAVLFELLLNAALYAETTPPALALMVSGVRWAVEIRNKSSQPIPPDWPVAGYRGPGASRRHPSGQGLGAFLACAGAENIGLRLVWTTENGDWLAQLTGGAA